MIYKQYEPHIGQEAFHYYMSIYRFLLLVAGIRSGKTFSGGYEAGKQAWNAKGDGVFGIIAPTYHMLDRTTWLHFVEANRPIIKSNNNTDKIITLHNGRRVHGHSADRADRIRNETFIGFWVDEARECKSFKILWNVLMGRLLSSGGKGFVTTSPNSFDDIHEIFFEKRKKDHGAIRFPTRTNPHINKDALDDLEQTYDEKTAQQELEGEFVIFQGNVYYAFNRKENAGQFALQVCQYKPNEPLRLGCDFNVNPMAWTVAQFGLNQSTNQVQAYFIDEINLPNSNTVEACKEFKLRYPKSKHFSKLYVYGDATGKARHTSSNITNWEIIKSELAEYNPILKVPNKNPAEKDRVNAVNSKICNSKGERNAFMHPEKCRHLIRDCEQVCYKDGSQQIDKKKDLSLTHPSDSAGYMIEKEFSLRRTELHGLKI